MEQMPSYEGHCPPSTMAFSLWPVCSWTFKGILCTCRFLWICPYNAVQFLPREKRSIKDKRRREGQNIKGCDCGVGVLTVGSPELHNRVSKLEKEVLTLKTRLACERASWERRFTDLQRRHQQVLSQVTSGGSSEPGGLDNGDVFEENTGEELMAPQCGLSGVLCRSEISSHFSCNSSLLSSRPDSSVSSVTSVQSWRSSSGPHRVFVPHSPLDLRLGHRVRLLLPSGRVSTGTLRFIGHLEGEEEEEVHLGIELHSPDHGLRDGSHRGTRYFQCKPGYGAFVPFHKLLMAWE